MLVLKNPVGAAPPPPPPLFETQVGHFIGLEPVKVHPSIFLSNEHLHIMSTKGNDTTSLLFVGKLMSVSE